MWRFWPVVLAFLPLTAGLGCMNPICGANLEMKMKNCDPDSNEICGQFGGRRHDNLRLEALDIPCPTKESIFAPISGELSYVMPFGGDESMRCRDQAARIDGTGPWQGYYALITTVILTKYGGEVSAGERIGYAGNIECHLDGTQQSDTNYVQLQVFKGGKPIDPTSHFKDCMCTGQICETNHKNQLIGDFKGDTRFNGVKGFEIVCPMAEEENEETDDIETRAPIIYSPIEGEIIGRKRLHFDFANQRYEGCDNEGIFIVGTNRWIDFQVAIYNAKYREDLGFGRKRIQQGQAIGYRLTCPKSPDSVFVEFRFQGKLVNVTNLVVAEDCRLNLNQKSMFLDYSAVDEAFGLEVVEELLTKHSYIAINLESLCQQLGWKPTDSSETDSAAFPVEKTGKRPELVLKPKNLAETDEDRQTLEILDGHIKLEVQEKPVEVVEEVKPKETSKSSETEDELDGPIGIDLTKIDVERIIQLEKTLEKDLDIENILRKLERMAQNGEKPYFSTFLLSLMKKVKYDPRSAPTLIEGQIINVYFGIHVQSISNFELATMDYDMDVWMRMAWRDPRLAHGFDAPILISEETILKKVWRPDPFFSNSKLSLFHRVTFLNFYMYVFPNGVLFFEARLHLKPKCVLTLCNYPHDSQVCSVKISSIAFTNDVVQFHWFPKRKDAIRFNRNVQLPELYIHNFSSGICDGQRKSGNFTCLEAKINMKRNLGFHLAQTYIPTATCVFFSWVSVWLPEEFVEGRIFVSLTVFLTLSAESNAAKETLPKVSYIKAIDIWFGFTATFVFSTVLQALVVILLEYQSKALKEQLEKNGDNLAVVKATKMIRQSRAYHRYGRRLDSFFKIMYPVIFVIFLIIYRFVIIEGPENKCLRADRGRNEL
uniref:Uncharacterized protein n=1 Tax=Panagrolaimus sp. JU765 TaxID=591449 RepID=A0AC34QGC8_9BILA